jgi:hypothetical protein
MSAPQDLHAAASHSAGKQGEGLLTPKEAARFLRLSESFLAKARGRDIGKSPGRCDIRGRTSKLG